MANLKIEVIPVNKDSCWTGQDILGNLKCLYFNSQQKLKLAICVCYQILYLKINFSSSSFYMHANNFSHIDLRIYIWDKLCYKIYNCEVMIYHRQKSIIAVEL
jgi:hypothetical protein